jgi:hypothetical protein
MVVMSEHLFPDLMAALLSRLVLRQMSLFASNVLLSILSSRAAVTKYHRLDSLHNRNLFVCGSGGYMSSRHVKVSTRLVGQSSLLGFLFYYFYFYFFAVLRLELRDYTSSHSTSPFCEGFFFSR